MVDDRVLHLQPASSSSHRSETPSTPSASSSLAQRRAAHRCRDAGALTLRKLQDGLYRRILDALPLELVVFDLKGRYRYISRLAVKNPEVRAWMIGRTNEEYVAWRGRNQHLGRLRDVAVRKALEHAEPSTWEETLTDGQGLEHVYRRVVSPVLNDQGTVEMAVGFGLEITENVAAALEIRQLNERLSALNEELEARVAARTAELKLAIARLEREIQERTLAEAALRESEMRYRVVTENITEAVLLMTLDGVYTYVSPGVEQNMGSRPEDLIGHSRTDILHPDDLPLVQAAMEAAVRTREPQVLRYRYRHPDGRLLWLESTQRVLLHPETGEPDRILIVARNVTQRHQHEEELRKLALVAAHTTNAVVLTDASGAIEWVNAGFTRITGYTLDEVAGQRPSEMLQGPETDPATVAYMRERQRQGLPFRAEILNYAKDGRAYWIELDVMPLHDEAGRVIRYMAIEQDITERKRIEALLRESEARFRSLVQNSTDVIALLHPDGTCFYTSPSVARMLGYLPDDLVGRRLLGLVHPQDQPTALTHVEQARAQPFAPLTWRTRVRHADGHWIHLEVILENMLADAAVGGLVLTCRDVTEQQRAADEMQRALDKERELNALKSGFVSMVSHEFRTPLTAIMGSAQMLSRYGARLDDRRRDTYLDRIQRNVREMLDLMEDMLLLGRSESGRLSLTLETLDLVSFVTSLVEEVVASIGTDRRIDVVVPPTPLRVCLDPNLMRQVLTNLLTNAVKYSPEGGPVTLRATASAETVHLEVQDEGIGIPAEDLPRLFEPFHRAHNVGTIRGTGLGLTISRRAVELHGGTLSVRSTPGVGTTFYVALPRHALPPPLPTESSAHA